MRVNVKRQSSRNVKSFFWASLFALALFLLLCGCVRREDAPKNEAPRNIAPASVSVKKSGEPIATFHEGDLKLPDNPDAPKLIYVDCREGARHAPRLNEHLEKALASGKFRLADSPSKAGYILHVNILRRGEANQDSLKQAVKAGYGGSANLNGAGGEAMLVDALMVQRRVPEAKRPSRQKMKNISARNALDSAQMRIGALANRKDRDAEDFSSAVAKELALRVER